MKRHHKLVYVNCALLLGILLMLVGCKQTSEKISDPLIGLNGSFEEAKNGLPVNWLMYSPKTVQDADFKIVLDNVVFKEGKQSLRFDVIECSSAGNASSPGFTNEFMDIGKFEGEGIYKLSFWIRNDGATYSVSAGGVAAMEGQMMNLIENSDQIDQWKYLEFKIEVPEDRWLRMQLNILKPGTFWIDDIRIEQI